MERGTRLLLDAAIGLGEVLAGLGNRPTGGFPEWLKSSTNIPKRTAYWYMSLFLKPENGYTLRLTNSPCFFHVLQEGEGFPGWQERPPQKAPEEAGY
jgi:hypothetical protein